MPKWLNRKLDFICINFNIHIQTHMQTNKQKSRKGKKNQWPNANNKKSQFSKKQIPGTTLNTYIFEK